MIFNIFNTKKILKKKKKIKLFSKKLNNFISTYSLNLIKNLKNGKINKVFIKNEKVKQITQLFFNPLKKFNLILGKKNILRENLRNNLSYNFFNSYTLKHSSLILLEINKLLIGTKNKLELELRLILLLNFIIKKFKKNKFIVIENIEILLLNKEYNIAENFNNIIYIFKFFSNTNFIFTLELIYYNKQLKDFNNSCNLFRTILLTEEDLIDTITYLKIKIKYISILYNLKLTNESYKEIIFYSKKLYPNLSKVEAGIDFLYEVISYQFTINNKQRD